MCLLRSSWPWRNISQPYLTRSHTVKSGYSVPFIQPTCKHYLDVNTWKLPFFLWASSRQIRNNYKSRSFTFPLTAMQTLDPDMTIHTILSSPWARGPRARPSSAIVPWRTSPSLCRTKGRPQPFPIVSGPYLSAPIQYVEFFSPDFPSCFLSTSDSFSFPSGPRCQRDLPSSTCSINDIAVIIECCEKSKEYLTHVSLSFVLMFILKVLISQWTRLYSLINF